MQSYCIIYKGVLQAKGYNGLWMCCDLLIEKIEEAYLVTFTEREDNRGTSVTNLSEQLATQVIEDFELDPFQCEFFEKYTYPNRPERLDKITYQFEKVAGQWVATSPKWQYMVG